MKLKFFGEIMTTVVQSTVRRIRSGVQQEVELPPPAEVLYRGFGSVPGETPDQFHDRMFEIPAIEAMLYETEFALGQCE
ncbi:MAG: hypothetical protein WAV09_01840 [Minisyncoccia bacterium]